MPAIPHALSGSYELKVPFVDLHRQYLSIKAEIDSAVQAVIDDSAFVGGRNNEYVTKFEEEWAEYLGAKHVVGCGNGTDALEIILEAMEIGAGDEVIVPAMTWISTAGAVARVGATPVFVDIHAQYYTIDPSLTEDAISDRTKAIIPVHLYGLPAEMDDILEIARRYDIKVIEDAAQAHGAEYKGRKAGTLADAAIFSFYPGKNLGAFGDAGCVVTDDADLAEEVRRIANHGQASKHDFRRLGRNSRLDGVNAAVLSKKLPHLESWIHARQAIAREYTAALKSDEYRLQNFESYHRHVFHLYVVLLQEEVGLSFLQDEEVSFLKHYPLALPDSVPFRRSVRSMSFPIANDVGNRGFSVPIFPEMTDPERQAVLRSCRYLKNRIAN